MPPDNVRVSLEDLDAAPVALPERAATDWEEKYHSISERFTTVGTENFELKEQIIILKHKNGTRDLLDQLIVPFAGHSFKFMCCYSGVVALLLFLHGLGIGFSLPENVLSLLVGSTAVTVIGLVGMVLTGVFVGARGK